jgi:hypothetical protein
MVPKNRYVAVVDRGAHGLGNTSQKFFPRTLRRHGDLSGVESLSFPADA